MSFVYDFIYLAAAVITVPLAKRLGLGSVLGYLLAGIVIGLEKALASDREMARKEATNRIAPQTAS